MTAMDIITAESLHAGFVTGIDGKTSPAAAFDFISETTGLSCSDHIFLRQIHSADILVDRPGTGDGIVLTRSGRCGCILTADCLSVAAADINAGVCGIFHSGWRGTVAGVVPAGISAMHTAGARNISAVIFPGIKRCCFEIGPELRDPFEQADIAVFSSEDSLHADIHTAVVRQLKQAGVASVEDRSVCTCCSSGFFSHRENGETARHLSYVTLPG